MGDTNPCQFVKQRRECCRGPFLEAGSRDYGSTQDIRAMFPGGSYVGVDISAGKAVDVVLDLTRPFSDVEQARGGQRFGTNFCLSVLERCENPFVMAENLSWLLSADGCLVVSVPFSWEFHGYSSDDWRFTHEGVKKLFPTLGWSRHEGNMSTSRECEFRELNEDVGKISLSGKRHRQDGKLLRGLSADVLKVLRRLGLMRWLVGYRYLLAPTMINMVGVRRD